MSSTESHPDTRAPDWAAVQASPEFQQLRHRLRSFIFPVTGLFLALYLVCVLLASCAPSLVAMAFAVAASANLPTILDPLFTTNGALWSMYGGLGVTVLLIVPVVSGKPIDPAIGRSPSMLQNVDFHWFPLDNPGIVSIPLSFLLGYLGTVWSKEKADFATFAEMEVRSLTGVGVEPAAVH
jgi:Na+(H+)/acetate symporter ActP